MTAIACGQSQWAEERPQRSQVRFGDCSVFSPYVFHFLPKIIELTALTFALARSSFLTRGATRRLPSWICGLRQRPGHQRHFQRAVRGGVELDSRARGRNVRWPNSHDQVSGLARIRIISIVRKEARIDILVFSLAQLGHFSSDNIRGFWLQPARVCALRSAAARHLCAHCRAYRC